MLPYSIFDSASLKVERANQHIDDLQAAFKAFTEQHGHTVHIHGHPGKGPLFFEIVFDAPLPTTLALILSDAIHNLRTALDHATWALLGLEGSPRNRHTKFPSGDKRVNFESACKGIKASEQSTTDFFVQLAIYPEGAGELLYRLCQIDNAEKHTTILPVVQAASVDSIEFFDSVTKERWIRKNVMLRPCLDGRSYIEIDIGTGIDCNKNFETTEDIFFGNIQGVPNEPIIPTLLHFRDAVTDTLREFRRLVVARFPGIPANLREKLIE